MVGKFIAWLLRKAGYDLKPVGAVLDKLEFLDAKAKEMDGVVCDIIDDIEEFRKVHAAAAETKGTGNEVAQILNEYFYGYQQKRSDDE